MELETDDQGNVEVKVGDGEKGGYQGHRLQSEYERAIETFFDGKSDGWKRAFMTKVLVAFDVIGNRRYGFDPTQLVEWFTANT
jgi:hypothetical protein